MKNLCWVLLLVALVCAWGQAADTATSEQQFPEAGIRRIFVSTVTETSATVVWTTASAECDEIAAWTQDYKLVAVKEEEATRDHRVTLRGLDPGVIYHYVIKGPSAQSYVAHFRTIDPLPGEPDFTMAVVPDPQFDGVDSSGGKAFGRVVEDINARAPDFVIFPGDLVDNRNSAKKIPDFTEDVHGFTKAFIAFKQLADGLKMPYYVASGNHERLGTPGTREAYTRIFNLSKAYYSVDLHDRHFAVLDCRPDKEQLAWLERDLGAHPHQDVFVVEHYAVANDPFVFDRNRGVVGFEEVKRLLEAHGRVRAVYYGHKNTLSATIQKGILYVCGPRPSSQPCGYLMVKVYATGLVQTFRSTPGYRVSPPALSLRSSKEVSPGRLRWDPMYRWGRQEARNFSWRFGEPVTSTGVR